MKRRVLDRTAARGGQSLHSKKVQGKRTRTSYPFLPEGEGRGARIPVCSRARSASGTRFEHKNILHPPRGQALARACVVSARPHAVCAGTVGGGWRPFLKVEAPPERRTSMPGPSTLGQPSRCGLLPVAAPRNTSAWPRTMGRLYTSLISGAAPSPGLKSNRMILPNPGTAQLEAMRRRKSPDSGSLPVSAVSLCMSPRV